MTTTQAPSLSTIPTLTIGVACGPCAGGGISPAGVGEFVDRLTRNGHAVAYFGSREPVAHRVSGSGIGHNDAALCERRDGSGSMAAYYENGEAFGGRWWEDTGSGYSIGVRAYGCRSTAPFLPPRGVARTAASARLAQRSGVVDPKTAITWS